ncbi:hypothetical protein BDF19DRAFT_440536, partial [Syncephalis fuscata]
MCPYGDGGDVEQYMKNILQDSVTFGQGQTNGPSKKAVDLIQQLLNINSDKRPTAEQTLACPWFTGEELTPELGEEPVAATATSTDAAPAAKKQRPTPKLLRRRHLNADATRNTNHKVLPNVQFPPENSGLTRKHI